MAFSIRMLTSKGNWVDAFYRYPTKALAVKKMKELQREARYYGFKGTEGYDMAVFEGRKKVAETKR
jgi:CO dehydrogenase/acetyl-CoA synthase epsilon subunit